MVLDEVHTYQGAQGGEISMLLKRVRDRVNKSQKGIIQYIGTSATIGQTDEDLPKLVKFGSLLFDENFEYDSSLNVGDYGQRLYRKFAIFISLFLRAI